MMMLLMGYPMTTTFFFDGSCGSCGPGRRSLRVMWQMIPPEVKIVMGDPSERLTSAAPSLDGMVVAEAT